MRKRILVFYLILIISYPLLTFKPLYQNDLKSIKLSNYELQQRAVNHFDFNLNEIDFLDFERSYVYDIESYDFSFQKNKVNYFISLDPFTGNIIDYYIR